MSDEAMSDTSHAAGPPSAARPGGVALFLRRWAAHPLRMGSVVPSSPALCGRIVRHALPRPGRMVLELGAGTGVISRALLGAGLPASDLLAVEIDPDLALHLRRSLPGAAVLQGDARALPDLLPPGAAGRIGSVVCGIPLVLLKLEMQRAFVAAMERAAPGLGFFHYSYCVTSPLPARRLGLVGRRVAWTPLNLPPASVWHYMPV